jgi:hypothetical protein
MKFKLDAKAYDDTRGGYLGIITLEPEDENHMSFTLWASDVRFDTPKEAEAMAILRLAEQMRYLLK